MFATVSVGFETTKSTAERSSLCCMFLEKYLSEWGHEAIIMVVLMEEEWARVGEKDWDGDRETGVREGPLETSLWSF